MSAMRWNGAEVYARCSDAWKIVQTLRSLANGRRG
jgi:hypothetical protein